MELHSDCSDALFKLSFTDYYFSLRQSCVGLWVWKFLTESFWKFPELYSNLSRNFRKLVNYLCQSAVSKSSITKWCCKISMFLTSNCPDLYALTLCVLFRKNNLFLPWLPRISANPNENYKRYNFHTFANISGKFPKILSFRKIDNPSLVIK